MQGNVRIKYTSWISEMGHICHGWTFGTWTASAPQRLSLNKEEEIQNLKMFHPGQKLETSVTDELLATWTAPWDPQEAGQGDSLTVAGYCMVSHVTAWYYMVSYKVLQGPVSPQEQKWTFGQGDSWTVADSTSQSGRRRKCKTGKCEKEIDKSEEKMLEYQTHCFAVVGSMNSPVHVNSNKKFEVDDR